MDTRGSGRAAAPSERFNPRTFSGAVGATGHVQERSEPHHLHVDPIAPSSGSAPITVNLSLKHVMQVMTVSPVCNLILSPSSTGTVILKIQR